MATEQLICNLYILSFLKSRYILSTSVSAPFANWLEKQWVNWDIFLTNHQRTASR